VDGSSGAQWKPALAAGRGDTAYAAWVDERDISSDDALPQAHVRFARVVRGAAADSQQVDGGKPVALAAKLDNSWAPRLASRGKRVLVTWTDFLNYDWGVFSRLSSDRGASFAPQVRVTNNTEGSGQREELADDPDATLGTRKPLIAWTDWRKRDSAARTPHQEYDIFVAAPGGANRQVDGHGTRQVSAFAPSICTTPGHAFVAFQDASHGRSEIRLAALRGDRRRGRTLLVSNAPRSAGNAWRPRLACSGTRVLALWEDERDGPPQIYLARAAAAPGPSASLRRVRE
jgi:hypothetical protein